MKKGTFTISEKTTRIALIASVFYETVGAILAPLAVFAGGGWFLDRALETGRFFLFLGVAFAFVVTQVILFLKVRKFTRNIENLSKEKK